MEAVETLGTEGLRKTKILGGYLPVIGRPAGINIVNNENYNEFKKIVVADIKNYLPETFGNAKVEVRTILKNNDQALDGLTVLPEGTNMAPTVYLNGFYEEIKKGESLDTVMNVISNIITENQADSLNLEKVTAWEQARHCIFAKVTNAERNMLQLAGRPHKLICDLAVTYHVMLGVRDGDMASTAVTDELFQGYGISIDELHEAAMKNMPILMPTTFKSMFEVIAGMKNDIGAGSEADEILDLMPSPEEGPGMFVLSNKSGINGAAAILDREKLDEIAEKLGDFYILPSSVHEVLIVTVSRNAPQRRDLEDMVRSVNATQVDPVDFLSDNVYAYSKDGHEFMLAEEYEKHRD